MTAKSLNGVSIATSEVFLIVKLYGNLQNVKTSLTLDCSKLVSRYQLLLSTTIVLTDHANRFLF